MWEENNICRKCVSFLFCQYENDDIGSCSLFSAKEGGEGFLVPGDIIHVSQKTKTVVAGDYRSIKIQATVEQAQNWIRFCIFENKPTRFRKKTYTPGKEQDIITLLKCGHQPDEITRILHTTPQRVAEIEEGMRAKEAVHASV